MTEFSILKRSQSEMLESIPLLQRLMKEEKEENESTILQKIAEHAQYTLAREAYNFCQESAYLSASHTVRDTLIRRLGDTNRKIEQTNPKRVFYLSIEYLLGRSLRNALLNLGNEDKYTKALDNFGYKLEDLYDVEVDAGLGNGGLGRLAACYLDSMATQNIPAWGYGLRYTYGMFKQYLKNGWQAEAPDIWLKQGNPWEIVRYDVKYLIHFGGVTITWIDDTGNQRRGWKPAETVYAVAHDTPIPGYNTRHTVNLRLWNSEPSDEFNLEEFNNANYYKAIEKRQKAESISSVLYPNDNKYEGKQLRLKQQFFFCSATMQDIVANYKKHNSSFSNFPSKVCIQLNDTHPTISIVELMRILLDVEGLGWDEAREITSKSFAYTNHTVLPEALEKWPVNMIEQLLPRHMEIIYEINQQFLDQIRKEYPDDEELVQRMSVIEEYGVKMVRMANLAIIMCFSVNGVAKIHSDILKEETFPDFDRVFPQKFKNVTNGVTPRRWLAACNPQLYQLIKNTLGSDTFLTNLDLLSELKNYADDPAFQRQWMNIKFENKSRLAEYIKKETGIEVNPSALFDVQIKRIHEYKRQLLNILRIIHVYNEVKQLIAERKPLDEIVPRVFIFAGKAAPGYQQAKLVIKLITSVAEVINNDHTLKDLLKVVFLPNYNVSQAELIIPASDISEHISTAGFEASGTSNMKFALNGGLIVGTLDGANIEIKDAIGHENIFIFGLTADQIGSTRIKNRQLGSGDAVDSKFEDVLSEIKEGVFGSPETFVNITNSLLPENDYYLLGNDFSSFLEIQRKVDETFKNKRQWAKMSILSTAGMGIFSSDRCILEYNRLVWGAPTCTY